MSIENIEKARFLHDQLQQPNNFNWSFVKEIQFDEVASIRGSRIMGKSEDDICKMIEKLDALESMYAAEIFPDRNPPEIVKADSMADTHEDFRKQHNSLEYRLSGDIMVMGATTFFMLDGICLRDNIIQTPTEATLGDVVDILLDMGCIPVDALFNIIPFQN